MKIPAMSSGMLSVFLLAALAYGQSHRYGELKRVIDRNTGFAHFTRGVNMYTLYALRGCVTERDVPVLAEMLKDKDRITRMAVADVLVDLGKGGRQVVESRLTGMKDAAEKMMLQDALNEAAKPDYRPILKYPVSDQDRGRIRGCK